jgi:hypothetical protein
MRVYLLGAGASYGYDPTLPSILRPPLTDEFFVKGVEWGILVEDRYPTLVSRLKSEFLWQGSGGSGDLDRIRKDIEPFLAKICNEFEKGEPGAQALLGEVTYYILDLLKRYIIGGVNRFDCYRRLALSYLDAPFYVVTLNYDVLLESAANAVRLSYCYGEPVLPKAIPIAKLHGSISWLNPIGRAIAIGGLRAGDIASVSRYIYSNRFEVGKPLFLSVQAVANITDFDVVHSGSNYYEPIIVPPQGEFKDYRKFKIIEGIWRWAEDIFAFADEIVIIGSSLRKEDSRLWSLISRLKAGTKLTIVNPHVEDLAKRVLEVNSKLQLSDTFYDFKTFTKTL